MKEMNETLNERYMDVGFYLGLMEHMQNFMLE